MQKIIVTGVLENNNKIFLAKRSENKKIAPGKWHLAGGHVEFGETCEEALIREFKEEFNLDIEVENIVGTFSYIHEDSHTIGICYKISCKNIPKTIWFDTKETQEIVWTGKDMYGEYVSSGGKNEIMIQKYLKTY